jgi:phospholipid/cholesterol/gamma-HCH transport system ATP-binding protein
MIQAENLNFQINNLTLLNKVNLTIEPQSRVAILGSTGCGKTLLLKILAGILMPTSGRLLINGKDILHISEEENLNIRRNLGFMFQDSALWENKTVFQNLELPLRYHHPNYSIAESTRIIENLLTEARISHERNSRPAVLSQGEARMVSFLRSIILDPSILFLDTPESSLDPEGIKYIEKKLDFFVKKKITLIFITSNTEWISKYSTHLLVMDNGCVLDYGPTRQLALYASVEVKKIINKVQDLNQIIADDILNLLEGE